MAEWILSDGTVIESTLSAQPRRSAEAAHYSTSQLMPGQIVAISPIDDENNLSRKYTEYHVLVNENNTNIMYKNCRTLDTFGGLNNFNEFTLPTGDKVDKIALTLPENRIGASVLLLCVGGNKDKAVIIGGLQHSGIRAKQNNPTAATTGVPALTGSSSSLDDDLKVLPTLLPGVRADDGERVLGEFNGIRWNVNKDGEFTIMFQGAKDKEGKLTSDAGTTIFKFNKNGDVFLLDKNDQEIKISSQDQTITISSGADHKIILDKQAQLILMGSIGNTFTVSEEDLRNFIQQTIFAVFNAHIHPDPVTGVTGPPTVLMPGTGIPGLIPLSPSVDGTPTSVFAARNTKVTKKTS